MDCFQIYVLRYKEDCVLRGLWIVDILLRQHLQGRGFPNADARFIQNNILCKLDDEKNAVKFQAL